MPPEKFVYVTYIRTSPEKLWEALTKPEFMKVYWFGVTMDCAWEKGAPWTMLSPHGEVIDTGEILESDRPKRLVIRWKKENVPEMKAEGYSRCTMELERTGDVVKLTIVHEMENEGPSKLIQGVSGGWPKILASLKSFLETGTALPEAHKWEKKAA